MTHELLEKMAKEYLENDISIKDLASNYHISRTKLIELFKGNKEIRLSEEMQEKINERKKERWLESKATSGNKGKFLLTKEQLRLAAQAYVEGDNLALKEVAAINKVSVGTIYNNFTQENLGEELYSQVIDKYNLKHKGSGKTGH